MSQPAAKLLNPEVDNFGQRAAGGVGADGVDADGLVRLGTDGGLTVSVTVRNTGDRDGVEVVQLYLHDPRRPGAPSGVRLVGYARVDVARSEARTATFDVPADVTCFTGREGRRIVEPGDIGLRLSASSVDVRHTVRATLVGSERFVDHQRRLTITVTLTPRRRPSARGHRCPGR